MIRQLAFDLPAAESYSAADFYPSPANAAALLAIQSQPRLLLIGPPGSGKTHLTHIWAASHQARIVSLTALPDALAGHRLAGHAADRTLARQALEALGVNPLIDGAFLPRRKAEAA